MGNQANLLITSPKAQQLQLVLTDAAGRRVMLTSIQAPAGTNTLQVPLPQLTAGMYYLQYSNGDIKQVIKMIKQ